MKNICLITTGLGMGGPRDKFVTWQIVSMIRETT